MFADNDHKPLSSLCMQVGYGRSCCCCAGEVRCSRVGMGGKWQAVRVDEEQEGCAEDRAVDVRCRPAADCTDRGQEGRGRDWKQGGWSDRSVHVSSSIHHTVPLWFNQTRNVLTEFDCRSTDECIVMQTPVHTCPYQTKISSNQMKRHVSLILKP